MDIYSILPSTSMSRKLIVYVNMQAQHNNLLIQLSIDNLLVCVHMNMYANMCVRARMVCTQGLCTCMHTCTCMHPHACAHMHAYACT